jgi:hypothetical protein
MITIATVKCYVIDAVNKLNWFDDAAIGFYTMRHQPLSGVLTRHPRKARKIQIVCTHFLIPYFLFLISYSLFLIPYFLFLIPYFLFLIPYSLFLIPYFLFLIPYSLFLISYFNRFDHDAPPTALWCIDTASTESTENTNCVHPLPYSLLFIPYFLFQSAF